MRLTPTLGLLSVLVVSLVSGQNIVFPTSGSDVNNPTCYGSRLDKIEFVQNMYVQYAEFMADVPDMSSFHTCFWINFKKSNRELIAINYSVNNNTNNDVITLKYSDSLSNSHWELIVNNVQVYHVKTLRIPADVWTHHCHSWDGNTGKWTAWADGALLQVGYTAATLGMIIPGGGVLVTGQHQDTLVDGMDRGQGLIGEITLLHLHTKPLKYGRGHTADVNYVRQLSKDCRAIDRGDVVGWLRTGRKTFGGVLTSPALEICERF